MEQRLQRINEKIQQVLRRYRLLQKDNERLQLHLRKLEDKNKQLASQVETLQQQVLVLKAGNGQMDAADKKELERRINHYIREVNKCITYLSE